tara:strand:+ start:2738 stop:3130 length:393 start_codon:yes stop_codon:yes gene_type:complete
MNAVTKVFPDTPATGDAPQVPRRRIVDAMGKVAEAARRRRRTAPSRPARARPSLAKFKLAALSWLVLYPLVTVLLIATAPLLVGQPIYLRTLAVSLVMVPAMVWIFQPRLARLAGVTPGPVPKAPADYCL